MPLIDASYFIGGINLPNISQPAVLENLDVFINKYEKKFLKLLLGDALYDLFIAGIAEDPIAEIWTDLKSLLVNSQDKESPIANYVYYYYTRDRATQTVGMGEVKPSGENGSIASPVTKQVRAWNEMVDFVRGFELDMEIYPEWVKPCEYSHYPYRWALNEIYHKINSLGL